MLKSSALAAALITAAVATFGYISNNWSLRRTERARTFADALGAMRDYQEYPYHVSRRIDSSSETLSRLGEMRTQTSSQVRYYLNLMDIESPVVGRAYRLLYEKTQEQAASYRDIAWQQKSRATESEMSRSPSFTYANHPELHLCIQAMRNQLSPLPWLRKRIIDSRVQELERSKTRQSSI